jgi:hypothetical protein
MALTMMISVFSIHAILGASLLQSAVSRALPTVGGCSIPATTSTLFSLTSGFPTTLNGSPPGEIELLARGGLPNGRPPANISCEGITNFQLIEFNENFEVAFFRSLISNITGNVPGFEIRDGNRRQFVLEVLVAVLAVSFAACPPGPTFANVSEAGRAARFECQEGTPALR